MLKKRPFYLLAICLFVAKGCGVKNETKEEGPATRPNIVFIMTDDHAIQALSCYDGRFNSTPNIDRIAKEGMLFTNSFVTNSICAPSRATMLTGKFTHINGQIDNRIKFDSTQWTFPMALQQAGYQTALIGKWHLRSQPMGFDHWNILPGQGDYYNPNFIDKNGVKREEGYATNIITDKAINWLENRNGQEPFCLLVHHKAPHRTWMPDTTDLYLYDDVKFQVPETYFDNYENRRAAAEQKMSIIEDMDVVYDLKMLDAEEEIQTKYRKAFEGQYNRMNEAQKAVWDKKYNDLIADFKEKGYTGKELALWKYQRYMEDYLACINSVDRNVGRILDYLDENNLTENTIIVYTSDQGFYLGEHGWFDKRFMYEESFKTPLLMRLPKHLQSTQGNNKEHLVQNIDYAPTFLDYAGVDIPNEVQGSSLRTLIENEKPEWRDALYYHYYEFPNEHMVKRHYGVRTDRYKLIHFYNDIDEWELYDLAQDPSEMNNLYGKEEYNTITEDLKQKLVALQEEYQDTDRSTY
ncbi:sulfatase [Fulvivirgaceae bacterium BMA10]|uniref:Sulfatase n=1 Tax=Splendidivirga corallicola TaxID=3051826 RepID=A0ABT8KN38_9BACT|nr:sulfatase [Fulvivirgaceae bacterium BMA10]